MAGVPLTMIAGKGVMVVMASRYVRGVVNACRKPADGDIIVPQHEVAILGTTSEQVPSADDISVPPADVDRMIDMCAQMVPAIASGRVLRAFAGSAAALQGRGPGRRTGRRGATPERSAGPSPCSTTPAGTGWTTCTASSGAS
jgi:glycerol-3-phosphate dehydrogenase